MEKLILQSHFKGDDFDRTLRTVKEKLKAGQNEFVLALRQQASVLRQDADRLDRVANCIEMLRDEQQGEVFIKGDKHDLLIQGPEVIIKVLKNQSLI